MGHFGFSYIGLIYMLMIQIPNILWTQRKPDGYDPSGENKVRFDLEKPLIAINDDWILVRQGVIIEGDKISLPVRILFEALGFKVDEQNAGDSVRIAGSGYDIILSPEKKHDQNTDLNELNEEEGWYISLAQLSQFGLIYDIEGKVIIIHNA